MKGDCTVQFSLVTKRLSLKFCTPVAAIEINGTFDIEDNSSPFLSIHQPVHILSVPQG